MSSYTTSASPCSLIHRALFLFAVCIPFVALGGPAIDIEINGLESEHRENVRNYLDIEKRKDNENFNLTWLKRLHAKAPDQIRAALEPFGYYNIASRSLGRPWTAC